MSFKIQADLRAWPTVALHRRASPKWAMSLHVLRNGANVTMEAPMKNDELPFPPHEPIPGERDPGNLTKREPGSMGGRSAGEDIPASSHLPWLDDVTASEHAHEGGLPANKTLDR